MATISDTWVNAFACHSKACAPPPAGKGGSTPGVGPLTAARARSLLKEELSGTSAAQKERQSHQIKGAGYSLHSGISIRQQYRAIPWMLAIEAGGMRAERHLATQATAITKKLKGAGYKVEVVPLHDFNGKPVAGRVTAIYADEA